MNNSENDSTMREEYDIKNLNPRRNPYSNRLKRPITINVNNDTIDYFKKNLYSPVFLTRR